MNPTVQPSPADDARLGAQVGADGTRFSLWAPRATRVELALVDEHRRQTNHDLKLVGEGVWEVHVPDVTAGQRYGYRVHGRWSP
ncbi:MAG TPA: glycogen debranching enzyme GlgX, partial [Propionicimonas sp.]